MAKRLEYRPEEVRIKLKAGVDAVANMVGITLGPKGRNVAIDKKWGAPSVIHDGVSVAKEIELKDPLENMGAQLVKEASSKTNDIAGDGTTTSTVIAQALVSEGIKHTTSGRNPMLIKLGLEKGLRSVLEFIDSKSKPVKGKQIEQVASISAGDELIGAKIAEALNKVGHDGVVTVEDGKGFTIEIEYKEGMEFDRGYVSPYFVTDTGKMESEIENPYILLTDKKISSIQDLLPFLEKFVKVSKNLVIIADEIEGEALTTLIVNKLKGSFNVLAIKAPGFGDRRKEQLEDLAILTGATVISEDTGKTFESVEIEDLGQAEKVWSGKEASRIIGGKGNKVSITKRNEFLKKQIKISESDFDKEKLQERLAKLSGGVAQINVGAATEVELSDKKERVKDAVGATKAAIEGGIIPGGGVVLLEATKILEPKLIEGVNPESDEAVGILILREALKIPVKKLADNAGQDGNFVVNQILEKEVSGTGYNVMTGKYEMMIEIGIVDASKVTKSAVQNAVSVASMILTTEGLITDEPEIKQPQMPQGGMGGMDY
jgi:chaperonin GroEL